jgi:multidrug efflux system membrane fusion protein
MSEPLNNNDPTKHFLHRRTLWIGFIIVILLLGMGGLYWKKAMSQPSEEYSQWDKPVPVRVVPVQRQDLQVEIKAIGTVVPTHTVNVQTQVSGVLKQIYFKEGQTVQKGQLLAQVDPAPFQVALAQAEGTQQQNLAQLRNAETELARYQLLFKQDSIAKQQVEQQQALVNQLKGQIQANRAEVDAAKLHCLIPKFIHRLMVELVFSRKMQVI